MKAKMGFHCVRTGGYDRVSRTNDDDIAKAADEMLAEATNSLYGQIGSGYRTRYKVY